MLLHASSAERLIASSATPIAAADMTFCAHMPLEVSSEPDGHSLGDPTQRSVRHCDHAKSQSVNFSFSGIQSSDQISADPTPDSLLGGLLLGLSASKIELHFLSLFVTQIKRAGRVMGQTRFQLSSLGRTEISSATTNREPTKPKPHTDLLTEIKVSSWYLRSIFSLVRVTVLILDPASRAAKSFVWIQIRAHDNRNAHHHSHLQLPVPTARAESISGFTVVLTEHPRQSVWNGYCYTFSLLGLGVSATSELIRNPVPLPEAIRSTIIEAGRIQSFDVATAVGIDVQHSQRHVL
mmetsp:Transcript_54122/g.123149  ORF Transcript_54122/g.123149 Transcript_54122/m.123149 type:complete len:294 (-) Transcript_54122:683-1564(-)